MSREFDLIRRHFTRPAPSAVLGVGDDCALLAPTSGMELAVTTDMLLEGRHFFPGADPRRLGHKALAVNLSDLAAMGARPRWITLAIALPEADDAWLAAFAAGLFELAGRHGVDLVGGDTTRGPLAISITALGEVPAGAALTRAGARADDDVWVSGPLGGAALAVAARLGRVELDGAEAAACGERLDLPSPRVELGLALGGLALAAIDISDGLVADLGHLAAASGLAAVLELARIPAAPAVARRLPGDVALAALLAGGDDYELCFTAPAAAREAIAALAPGLARIGRMVAGEGVSVVDPQGRPLTLSARGFDHFD